MGRNKNKINQGFKDFEKNLVIQYQKYFFKLTIVQFLKELKG